VNDGAAFGVDTSFRLGTPHAAAVRLAMALW
jgi:hypothetical protein